MNADNIKSVVDQKQKNLETIVGLMRQRMAMAAAREEAAKAGT